MIKLSRRVFIVLVLIIQIHSFCLFLVGFFPLKQTLPGTGVIQNYTLNKHIISQPRKLYDRTVLVLIDALRSDFIYKHENMPFVGEHLQNGRAVGYTVKAHPPTVTLPRIKVFLFN